MSSSKKIAVKRFESLDEIMSINGWKPNNPLTKHNYADLHGHYIFKDEDKVKCCLQKANGNLCRQDHQFGFVAKLRDNTITLLGNCCAKDNFDADTDIGQAVRRYDKEKDRLNQINTLKNIFEEKEECLMVLGELRVSLNKVLKYVSMFSEKVGNGNKEALLHMARTKNNAVAIKMVKYHEGDDGEGNLIKDKQVTKYTLGKINGVSIFNTVYIKSIIRKIDAMENAYLKLYSIDLEMSKSDAVKLKTEFDGYGEILSEGEGILKSLGGFKNNKFILMCFLTDNKVDQYKGAKAALEMSGNNVSRDKAKQWLGDYKRKLKDKHKVDRIFVIT